MNLCGHLSRQLFLLVGKVRVEPHSWLILRHSQSLDKAQTLCCAALKRAEVRVRVLTWGSFQVCDGLRRGVLFSV